MKSYKVYDLIRKPIISEKNTSLGALNKVTFSVDRRANKISVKEAIEAIFEVKVKNVNILNIKGKRKRFKGTIGVRSDVKKAIVTLVEGDTIDLSGGK